MFIYGENDKLKQLTNRCMLETNCGGVILYGETATGKTIYLHMLQKQLKEKKVEYIRGHDVMDDLYRTSALSQEPCLDIASETKVVMIDNLEDFAGRMYITQELLKLLKSNIETRLIICVANNKNIAELLHKELNFEYISISHVKPDMRIVQDKAVEKGIHLSEMQLNAFANLESILELDAVLNKICFDKYLDEKK